LRYASPPHTAAVYAAAVYAAAAWGGGAQGLAKWPAALGKALPSGWRQLSARGSGQSLAGCFSCARRPGATSLWMPTMPARLTEPVGRLPAHTYMS
jgi:hypothetical protein